MIGRCLLDSAVLIYAFGDVHRYRDPCRRLLQAAREGVLAAETTTLAIQEVMHQRARRTGDRGAAAEVAHDLTITLTTHELRADDVRRATVLFTDVAELDAAGACHAATAIARGIATIISPDTAFDAVADLSRLDPIDADAEL